jgi:hypothetical protein
LIAYVVITLTTIQNSTKITIGIFKTTTMEHKLYKDGKYNKIGHQQSRTPLKTRMRSGISIGMYLLVDA